MANWKKHYLGEVLMDKNDDTKSYIKLKGDMKGGTTYNLESAADQKASALEAFKDEKINQEMYDGIVERCDKIPAFVRFQITKLEKLEA